jgi:hypothetical protein
MNERRIKNPRMEEGIEVPVREKVVFVSRL